jgi:hypothetical protein
MLFVCSAGHLEGRKLITIAGREKKTQWIQDYTAPWRVDKFKNIT